MLFRSLKEGSAYTQVPYHILEEYDQNLLDEVNKAFVRAAVRCEDYLLMTALRAATSRTQFAGYIDRDTGALAFYAENIPIAIGKLLAAGKEVKPGELVCWMHAKAYAALLKELTASNAFTVADPNVVRSGLLEEYLGVKLLITGLNVTGKVRAGSGTGTCYPAYLFRPKRCMALAPKRDLLIETNRDIVNKKLQIAASHTCGVKILDFKEAVEIYCNTYTT